MTHKIGNLYVSIHSEERVLVYFTKTIDDRFHRMRKPGHKPVRIVIKIWEEGDHRGQVITFSPVVSEYQLRLYQSLT